MNTVVQKFKKDPKGVDLDLIGQNLPKELAGHGSAMPTGPPQDGDEFAFWRYADLLDRRIVADRADLFRKQQRGFPKAHKLTRGQGAVALFPVAPVKRWVRENIHQE